MIFVSAMLLCVCYALFVFNRDLNWQVKHYRRELDSAKKFQDRLIDQLSEADKMMIGKYRERLSDDDWPDVIG